MSALILSIAEDKSTQDVVKWLCRKGVDFYRINSIDKITDIEITLNSDKNDIKIEINNEYFVSLLEIESSWFRRGDIKYGIYFDIIKERRNKIFQNYLIDEVVVIRDLIFNILKTKRSINTFYDEVLNNKLIDLFDAHSIGFEIPRSLITGNKKKACTFLENFASITKSLSNPFNAEDGSYYISSGGTLESYLSDLYPKDDFYFASFLQCKIDKSYEVRVFYLHGEFYPMAIFSQLDDRTKLDYRNYNTERPNRCVPFKLPQILEKNILRFMHLKNYNSGSLDFIVTNSDEFVFLEVNPLGQYDWVSYNCNYYIDEIISNYLCNE